jgi:TPR repeat protein
VVVAPEGGVWLNEDAFDGPGEMISTLKPVVSTGPHSNNSVLSPALLAAALAGDQGLSDADRLTAGKALMTGLGAPRNREAAMRLLVPLAAGNWDAEAAMTLAQGLADMGDAQAAYPYALVALAGGNTAAASLAARLEADLQAGSVIETQAVILSSFPTDPGLADRRAAISANPDVAAMRTLALDTRLGRGVPRSYVTAYLYASLAAAAGDRASANLRDELDRLGAGDPGWAASLAEASTEALSIWTEEGLGEAIHSALGSR